MLSNKFLIMSCALFAVIIAVSAQDGEELISDRRFRWPGSNEQEAEGQEEETAEAEAGESDNEDGAEPEVEEIEDAGNEQVAEDPKDSGSSKSSNTA